MLTFLSPAKTLDFSAAPAGLAATQPRFEQEIAVLMKRCKKLDVESLQELMSLSPSLAQLNYERFQEMSWPFTPKNAKACLLAFRGDVYKKLDAATLSNDELKWAQDHLRILSGFYGMLRPLDLIQPYRLEMGTKLDTPRGENLYEFWDDRLVDEINAEHARKPLTAVVNLASVEYFKAVPADRLKPQVITPVFQEKRGGGFRTIGLLAKRARGLMARFIVRNLVRKPDQLLDFNDEGYGFRSDLSGEGRLVFTREQA